MGNGRQLYEALYSLPMIDENVFLNMQAQQIGLLDEHIEGQEDWFRDLWFEREKFPAMESMFLVAIGQCWIFSLYELLRTWRQLATEIVAHAADTAGKSPDECRVRREGRMSRLERPAPSENMQEGLYVKFLERAETDSAFVSELKRHLQRIEEVFRTVEGLRVTLAKHEVAKAGKGRTYMPPYARGEQETGSMMWLVEDRDGSSSFVSRRAIADAVRGLA